MLFCRKEKKKKHILLKAMIGSLGVTGVVCLCHLGTKCLSEKMCTLGNKVKGVFVRTKEKITESIPQS